MATTKRVTLTLPIELVRSIDALERSRSRFIAEAVRHELFRRRRVALMRSREHPHPEATDWADVGPSDWRASLPPSDAALVDPEAGTPVRWVHGEGWVEEDW